METELPDKLHSKGFCFGPPGLSQLVQSHHHWELEQPRGWFEQEGEEKCSVHKPCPAFG